MALTMTWGQTHAQSRTHRAVGVKVTRGHRLDRLFHPVQVDLAGDGSLVRGGPAEPHPGGQGAGKQCGWNHAGEWWGDRLRLGALKATSCVRCFGPVSKNSAGASGCLSLTCRLGEGHVLCMCIPHFAIYKSEGRPMHAIPPP